MNTFLQQHREHERLDVYNLDIKNQHVWGNILLSIFNSV